MEAKAANTRAFVFGLLSNSSLRLEQFDGTVQPRYLLKVTENFTMVAGL
jgi:hypothetical protein